MKILLASNAPWVASGYGQQSKFLLNSFRNHGHEVIFATNFGLCVGIIEMDGVTYLPEDGDYGNNTIHVYSALFEPDVVVSLVDWFALNSQTWGKIEAPWYSWTPIDMNITNKKEDVFYGIFDDFLNICRVVTMSNFGTNEVNKYGYSPSGQIYHMVDASIFQKLDKKRCRDMIIPNHEEYDFIVGMVMGNYDAAGNRKVFNLQLEALKLFAIKNPKLKILLYMHTEMTPKLRGLDLNKIIEDMDLEKYIQVVSSPSLKVVEMPYTQQELALLYNCFDVVMNSSSAEGFGIPIVEAQSCGVPVLTHDSSAMSELTHYGYAAQSNNRILSVSNSVKRECIDCGHTEHGQYVVGERREPSIKDMVKGLQYIYENRSEKDSQDSHEWVADTFNPTVIGDAWEDLITGKRG